MKRLKKFTKSCFLYQRAYHKVPEQNHSCSHCIDDLKVSAPKVSSNTWSLGGAVAIIETAHVHCPKLTIYLLASLTFSIYSVWPWLVLLDHVFLVWSLLINVIATGVCLLGVVCVGHNWTNPSHYNPTGLQPQRCWLGVSNHWLPDWKLGKGGRKRENERDRNLI